MVRKKLTNFEEHLQQKLKNKKFKKLYEEEVKRLEIVLEIVELRKKYGYTQKELARKLDTTQSVVARMEAGNQNLTTDTLYEIAKVFHKELKIKFV